jgi:hypothetical protein
MSDERIYYAVDRLEGDRAVLVNDRREQVELAVSSLPFRVREGMVLLIPVDRNGRPEWFRAVRDEGEERRRLKEGADRLERLRRRDPGGDISL